MFNKSIFFAFMFVFLGLLSLHLLAIKHFLYFYHWWFDIPMHFLGGLMVGLFTLWIYYYSPLVKKKGYGHLDALALSFFAVLCIGIFWELYEYINHIIFSVHYGFDTVKDIFIDLLGALVAWFFYIWRRSPLPIPQQE